MNWLLAGIVTINLFAPSHPETSSCGPAAKRYLTGMMTVEIQRKKANSAVPAYRNWHPWDRRHVMPGQAFNFTVSDGCSVRYRCVHPLRNVPCWIYREIP